MRRVCRTRQAVSLLSWSLALGASQPLRAAEDVVYREEPVKLQPLSVATAASAFDLQSLRPMFTSGPLAQASERLRSGDAAGAARILAEQSQKPDVAQDIHARFLLALAQLRTAQSSPGSAESVALAGRAAVHFDALSASYPMLRTYHVLFAAKAYLVAGQPQPALARAQAVPSDSVLDCEARFLTGEALRQGGPDDATRNRAVQAYRSFVSVCPHSHRLEAAQRQAELLDALHRPAEALQIWRRLYIEAPHDPVGALAAKRFDQLGQASAGPTPATAAGSVPPRVPPFTATELLQRAQVLFDHMRNAESEAAYRWALEQPDIDDAQRCVARYNVAQSVFKQRQRKRSAQLFDDAVQACAPSAAKNEDLHMKALYQGARGYANGGEHQKAADLFALAEATYPGHSYADDCRLRQAEMYAELVERLAKEGAKKTCNAETCPDYEGKLTALLSDLPDRYPQGDRRAEALWRLSLRSLRRGDLKAAQAWLSQSLAKIPREVGWDQEGRTLYWLGRIAELNSDGSAAVASYSRAAREYPLSFYALLSLSRLAAGFPKESDALLRELLALSPASPGGVSDEFRFAPRALFAHPAFLRGVELLRLGLGSEARREFQSIGIGVPEEKGARDLSPEREEMLWLAAVLFDRAGAWHLSHFVPRYVVTEWQRHYPTGPWRKQWLLAYPRGFADLITASARDNSYPEMLQLAIVREESAFDPRTESFANAVGLTQMIQPTAKRFSGGLPFDPQSLRDPSINVAIGGRFLSFIYQLWQKNPALTVPSYNAGEGAVVRWLKSSVAPGGIANLPSPPGLGQVDLFIESIPYDETRGYTKRVLSSYLIYQWLYGAASTDPPEAHLPSIPFALPAVPVLR